MTEEVRTVWNPAYPTLDVIVPERFDTAEWSYRTRWPVEVVEGSFESRLIHRPMLRIVRWFRRRIFGESGECFQRRKERAELRSSNSLNRLQRVSDD